MENGGDDLENLETISMLIIIIFLNIIFLIIFSKGMEKPNVSKLQYTMLSDFVSLPALKLV